MHIHVSMQVEWAIFRMSWLFVVIQNTNFTGSLLIHTALWVYFAVASLLVQQFLSFEQHWSMKIQRLIHLDMQGRFNVSMMHNFRVSPVPLLII